jgi:equilibrative nucleoside transporter 1/2/3
MQQGTRSNYSVIQDEKDAEIIQNGHSQLEALDIEKDSSDNGEDSQILLAKIFMSMIGIGYLFPFSALTQPVDYWHELFPDFNIEFPLTAVFFGVNLMVLFLIVFFGGKSPNFQIRIVGGFVGQLIILILVPSLTYMHLSSKLVHYQAVMIATAVVAAFTALLDSVVIGFASLYPAKVLEGLQIGIGLSSLIGSVYRIITKWAFPPEAVILSSLIYFFTGAVTIGFCIASYYALVNMPISHKYLRSAETSSLSQANSSSENTPLRSNSEYSRSTSGKYSGYDSVDEESDSSSDTESVGFNTSLTELDGKLISTLDTMGGKIKVLRKVVFHQFLVLVVYMTSLAVFPALITEIPSYNFPDLQASRWWSLLLLLFFCILDTFGRFLTPYRLGMTHQNIHYFVFFRILFFPCLYACLKGDPAFLRNDLYSLFFVGVFGFTNGHMGSICIMMVSEQVTEMEKSLVGGFTGFWLNLGLVLGSTMALLVDKYLLHGQ